MTNCFFVKKTRILVVIWICHWYPNFWRKSDRDLSWVIVDLSPQKYLFTIVSEPSPSLKIDTNQDDGHCDSG